MHSWYWFIKIWFDIQYINIIYLIKLLIQLLNKLTNLLTVYIKKNSYMTNITIYLYGPVQKDLHFTEKENDLHQEIYCTT
jgi:hypothetical protein